MQIQDADSYETFLNIFLLLIISRCAFSDAFWCVCPDASWELGDRSSSSAGVGSAQEVVGQVSLIFFHLPDT